MLQLSLRYDSAIEKKICQRPTDHSCKGAVENPERICIAAGDVAFKIGGEDKDSGSSAGIRGERTRCRNGLDYAAARVYRCLSPRIKWLRIEIYGRHPARLELILTQRTEIAGSMQP